MSSISETIQDMSTVTETIYKKSQDGTVSGRQQFLLMWLCQYFVF